MCRRFTRQRSAITTSISSNTSFSLLPRVPSLGQMLYLFLLGIPMSITGALITLPDTVLYPFYAAAPRVWSWSAQDDQKIGGLLMWVGGGLMLWVVVTVVWFRYSRREHRADVDEAVPLEAYGATPRPGSLPADGGAALPLS